MALIPVLLLIFCLLPTCERTHIDASRCADFICKLHETTKINIKKMNEKYRVAGSEGRKELKLNPGDLVWLHLRKERFPEMCKSKLMPRAAGPYKIIEKINDLTPYLGEEDELKSRTTPF
jgi:hypothetical protein